MHFRVYLALFCILKLTLAQRANYYHHKSKGFPWPLPKKIVSNSETSCFIGRDLEFDFGPLVNCDLMMEAEKRTVKHIFGLRALAEGQFHVVVRLNGIEELPAECNSDKMPPHDMDESYHLEVKCPDSASLSANSIWGLLRGIETFSQLVYIDSSGGMVINETWVEDKPAFQWRGILLDTGHRFQPLAIILKNLEIMAMNKFNVFHWHLVDDPSFPWVSEKFPELAKLGAYPPAALHSYSPDDVQRVLQTARLLGIRVVPEFDTPGHSQSWGSGLPQILTKCYDKGKPDGTLGPIDPSSPILMESLRLLFGEVFNKFSDEFVHLGGDEVFYGFDCWLSNPRLRRFMKNMNLATGTEVQRYYTEELIKLLSSLDRDRRTFLFWEDVFNGGIPLPVDKSVIHVWSSNQSSLERITELGFRALYSSCWYLDHIETGTSDWIGYYSCDPLAFHRVRPEQKRLVLGGEACIWTKYVDATNLLQRLWPRASAVAERLWTNPSDLNKDVELRLEEHRCRMISRGYPAQPVIGPGFCEFEFSF